MKIDVLDEISRESNLDRETLITRGVQAFLREKKARMMLERLERLSHYGVASRDDLLHRIEAGEIPDHPAWEDLIVIENLEASLKKIDQHLADL